MVACAKMAQDSQGSIEKAVQEVVAELEKKEEFEVNGWTSNRRKQETVYCL